MSMEALFETERLMVRQFQPRDLDEFAALCADPRVMRFMGDGVTLTRSDVDYWIQVCQQKYAARGYGTSAVFETVSGQFLGYCGVIRAPGSDFDELTYAFHVASWGKGYASEVGGAMLDYVFARSALERIYATIDPDNRASIHVVEKLGFQFERQNVEEEDTSVNVYFVERRG